MITPLRAQPMFNEGCESLTTCLQPLFDLVDRIKQMVMYVLQTLLPCVFGSPTQTSVSVSHTVQVTQSVPPPPQALATTSLASSQPETEAPSTLVSEAGVSLQPQLVAPSLQPDPELSSLTQPVSREALTQPEAPSSEPLSDSVVLVSENETLQDSGTGATQRFGKNTLRLMELAHQRTQQQPAMLQQATDSLPKLERLNFNSCKGTKQLSSPTKAGCAALLADPIQSNLISRQSIDTETLDEIVSMAESLFSDYEKGTINLRGTFRDRLRAFIDQAGSHTFVKQGSLPAELKNEVHPVGKDQNEYSDNYTALLTAMFSHLLDKARQRKPQILSGILGKGTNQAPNVYRVFVLPAGEGADFFLYNPSANAFSRFMNAQELAASFAMIETVDFANQASDNVWLMPIIPAKGSIKSPDEQKGPN